MQFKVEVGNQWGGDSTLIDAENEDDAIQQYGQMVGGIDHLRVNGEPVAIRSVSRG